ncbi:MAG: nickel pincer cofactor biosynthesis protein LarC [Phycisphaerae bacterium]
MSTAYFDCFNGAAGDMILGALIDARLPADELRAVLNTLPIDGYELSIERINKQGFAATRFDVKLDRPRKQPHRHLADIRRIIEGSSLSKPVQRRALAVFERLAKAEARVHGTTVDQVHFHEVGAVDSVIDIVGACWAIERLRIDRVVCSPIPTGSGTVTCAHGVMPVPTPATAILLQRVPLAENDEPGELTTPTGAAILTELAESFGPLPAMRIDHVGMGAGRREGKRRPNVLRVMVGSDVETPEMDRITVLEANLDDSTPEIIGHAIERLLAAGALDAYCLPIQMKKSRPGLLLTVLAEVPQAGALESIMFAETTTFGIRRHEVLRSKLSRRIETVETRFGPIKVKIGGRGGCVVSVAAEYEDCRAAAAAQDAPLREVMSEAVAVWKGRQAGGGDSGDPAG